MDELVNLFRALSDKTRLRILKLLEMGELCVCDVVAALNAVQPKVSFHLNVLKKAGLVKDRREGKSVYYRIDDSDIFKRFLTLSVFERMNGEIFREDRKRLEVFLETKKDRK